MLYSALITELRRDTRDLKYKMEELFDGDGTVKVFILKHHPVHENSQQVLVGGSLQTETTHYTFDDDLGEIEFTTAPASGSDNVKCTYRYANFRDQDWIEMINDGIEYFGEKFWTEVLDRTTLDTTANQSDYSLASLSNGSYIFRLLSFEYRTTSSSSADVSGNPWISFGESVNMAYLKDSNTVRFKPPFPTGSYDIRVRAIRRPVPGTATTDTVDVEDDEMKAIKHYAISRYYFRLAALKAGDVAAISKDATVSPERVLMAMGKDHLAMAEQIAKRVRKPYPTTTISHLVDGRAF